ncbi:hypothetical protein U1Q18_018257 [Sarracenia purpurea var. burkii]
MADFNFGFESDQINDVLRCGLWENDGSLTVSTMEAPETDLYITTDRTVPANTDYRKEAAHAVVEALSPYRWRPWVEHEFVTVDPSSLFSGRNTAAAGEFFSRFL